MHRRRAQLSEHGVVYPGTTRRPLRAGYAVLGRQPRGRRRVDIGEWRALVEEVAAAGDKRVCVSTEDFGSAGPEQARRIVGDLGGEQVHVVAVARRLDKLLPSQWQERVKSHRTRPYDSWLRGVLGTDTDDPDYKAVWSSHQIPNMIRRWQPMVSPDRFHVVVTDDSDPRWLPHVFESLLGLPDDMLVLTDRLNSSLSGSAVELLRRLNGVFLREKWPDEVYFRLVQRGMILALGEGSRSALDAPIPAAPGWARQRMADLAAGHIEEIRELGVDVIGDLDVLRLAAGGVDEAAEPEAAQTISIDAALRALDGTIRGAIALDAAHRKRRGPAARKPASVAPAGRKSPPATGTPGARTHSAGKHVTDLADVPTTQLLQELRRRGSDRVSGWRDSVRATVSERVSR